METQIIKELVLLLEKMAAGSAILSIVNSYKDSLSDKEVIENLRLVNKHYSKYSAEAQVVRLQEKYNLNAHQKINSDNSVFEFLPMKRKVTKNASLSKPNTRRKQKH